jgi:hypothetical protein
MIQNRIQRAIRMTLMILLTAALAGFIVMKLWNWLMPAVTGWHAINFWQALGLLVLSKILFGGFRGGWGHGRHWRRGMRERWEQMTPEQREHFRARCSRFGARMHPGAEPTQPRPEQL